MGKAAATATKNNTWYHPTKVDNISNIIRCHRASQKSDSLQLILVIWAVPLPYENFASHYFSMQGRVFLNAETNN